MLLADFGADVIKVERMETGDDTRQFLPLVDGKEESGYFMYYNRNKKSIELDLKKQEAREIIYKIVKNVDIVVENYAPGVAARLGIDYDTLKQYNPKIIYGSISGFGQTGPYRNKTAYDIIAQAMGGFMSVTGERDGRPLKLGTSIADGNAGIHMAFAIMSAVYYRNKTGIGQYIDVSMQDTTFSTMENMVMLYTYGGVNYPRSGNHQTSAAPFNAFKAKDGKYVAIAVANDSLFSRCMTAMGMPELIDDPRFANNKTRKENEDIIDEIVGGWVSQKNSDEICELLEAVKIPVGTVLSIPELIEDPQLKARDMIVEMDHTTEGSVIMPGSPFKFSETKIDTFNSSPLLGENNEEILREYAECSDGEIDAYYKAGTIKRRNTGKYNYQYDQYELKGEKRVC